MKHTILGALGLAALVASAPVQAATEYNATQYVDARGEASPMPVLKTRKTMRTMNPGETVEVRATDPQSVKNIEEYCKEEGNKLLILKEEAGVYIFLIEKQ